MIHDLCLLGESCEIVFQMGMLYYLPHEGFTLPMKRLSLRSVRFISRSFFILSLLLAGCRVQSSLPENPVKPPSNPQNALKIMPLGDSITDGYDVPGGYRTALWQKLTERGYILDFVGSM